MKLPFAWTVVMVKLSDLPCPVLHLMLSFLDTKDAFLCSSVCHSIHTAATYYFYDEYIKENWSLPLTPRAIVDYFVTRSRKLWTAGIGTAPRVSRVQNVKAVAHGPRFFAYATHKHEVLIARDEEVRARVRLDKAVEQIAAGKDAVGVVLRDGSSRYLSIQESSVSLHPIPSPSAVTRICIFQSYAVFSTIDFQVFAFAPNTELAEVRFDPEKPNSPVLDLQCRGSLLLILFEGGKLFKTDAKGSFRASLDLFFKKKPVGLVATGVMHNLALHRDERPQIAHWDSLALSNWLDENGFGDISGVVSRLNVCGKALENANDDYLIEVLSINEPERRQRLRELISTVQVRALSPNFTIYAWGKNTDSQLGMMKPVSATPIPLESPLMRSEENVKSLHCVLSHSVVFTTGGRVLVLGGIKLKARDPVKPITWVDITEEMRAGNNRLTIEEVFAATNEILFFTCQKPKLKLTQKRTKDSSAVMQQLWWDPGLNLAQIVVGCEEKNGEVVEITAEEFKRRSRITVKYVKRWGEVVWDIRNRQSLL